ncbi:diguanylate cyclase [Aliiglaciecola sp. CAU 1673]|uniref:GGDEF domain-containing protein n=1 Tax=Aliiglaciecola sp. CAU 1673 TaxID=3032595 RepID=UPI0023DC163F|nr:diguanylate cyclase [Aliiglaciecola sp. CAU 1673]MDF2176708.1 diguanylate cyclase [Aliiglaciecola sp. CAU 1673]
MPISHDQVSDQVISRTPIPPASSYPPLQAVKPRVLIIDDEKANLKVLSEILREEVDIVLAANGPQGIRKATEYLPDLILLDVVMPQMDGFEVIAKLKQHQATSAIPVIFITALGDSRHEEKGLLLGARDYIQKPFHSTIVLARIRLHLELVQQRRMLEQLANIDPLTSLANRRKFEEILNREWLAAIREKSALSLVMIDIDNFKQFNDSHGHAVGDILLQEVAAVIAAQLRRPKDLVARYGGEEFVALLCASDHGSSRDIMESCRLHVASLMSPRLPQEPGLSVTISVGGYTCQPKMGDRIEDALKKADELLYQAKHQGKNQVVWNG